MTQDERCAEFRQLQRIDDAFRAGDLDALRAAVDDPSVIPNGTMPDTIGPCLTYAVYCSPLPFIRTLLALGADPSASADDGFPPLIAALSTAQPAPGVTPRADADEVLRVLLRGGADPNQRGINDYTPLHMAVGVRRAFAVQLLLDFGADPDLRTRIDAYETPLEMAWAGGAAEIAAILARRGAPLDARLRSGVTLLGDFPGDGAELRRQQNYRLRLRLWLESGEPVRWRQPSGPVGAGTLEDDGATLTTEMRLNRGHMMHGLFYGLDGMRVGGTRRLRLAPHVAAGERGVPDVIPPAATLTAEVTVLGEAAAMPHHAGRR